MAEGGGSREAVPLLDGDSTSLNLIPEQCLGGLNIICNFFGWEDLENEKASPSQEILWVLLSRWAPTEVECGGFGWEGVGGVWGNHCLLRILLGQFQGEDVVLSIPSWVGNLQWPWEVCWGHHIHPLDPAGTLVTLASFWLAVAPCLRISP